MEVVIKKKEQNTWPRFTKDTKKLAYVGVDWNNWVDSDDEDPEEEDQQQGTLLAFAFNLLAHILL